MWRSQKPHTLLVGMENDGAYLKKSLAVPHSLEELNYIYI